jgi:hypothetical protein
MEDIQVKRGILTGTSNVTGQRPRSHRLTSHHPEFPRLMLRVLTETPGASADKHASTCFAAASCQDISMTYLKSLISS